MRRWAVISVLALAGCGEHLGFNPNYQFGSNAYGEYRVAREAALVSGKKPPVTIPIALPAEAPSAAQIAGRDPVPVPATMGVRTRRAATTTTPAAPAAIAAPVTTSGPYPGSTPVLVRYAYAAQHKPGTKIYARKGASQALAARVCAGFATPSAAQTAFLAAGGPETDSRGMDPDGDGFVCGWDPAPFRQAQL